MDAQHETGTATGNRRSPAKRRAILRAATEAFLSQGYARTSVDAIAAAAGVGKQTVYGHFGNKERLFLAVVEQATRDVGIDPEAPTDVITASGDPRADLQKAGERLLRAMTAPAVSALHRLTIAEVTHHPELQRHWRDTSAAPAVIEAIAEYLAELDRHGDLQVPEPALSARQFVMLLGAEGQVRSLHGLRPLDPSEIRQVAAETADLILRAHRR